MKAARSRASAPMARSISCRTATPIASPLATTAPGRLTSLTHTVRREHHDQLQRQRSNLVASPIRSATASRTVTTHRAITWPPRPRDDGTTSTYSYVTTTSNVLRTHALTSDTGAGEHAQLHVRLARSSLDNFGGRWDANAQRRLQLRPHHAVGFHRFRAALLRSPGCA